MTASQGGITPDSQASADIRSAAGTDRSARIDALRGVAVFGILLVNVWSFVWGFVYLRYGTLPPEAAPADRLTVWLVAFLAEQKFYPVFAFLFGAGFALQTRSLRRMLGDWGRVRLRYTRRLVWLLGCGVLHGTLIWFGDILTVYGLTGFLILPLAGARLKRIVGNLWNWSAVWLLLVALSLVLALTAEPETLNGQAIAMVEEAQTARLVYTQGAALTIAAHRLADYFAVTSATVYLVPQILVLFLAGMLSVRLGWLTAPRRHALLWRRARAIGFAVGIPFNLLWAFAVLDETMDPARAPLHTGVLHALLPVGGTVLAAAYVASLMLAGGHALRVLQAWIAPVGRMSLTNYLLQSSIGVFLLQGAGLGLGRTATHAQLLLIALSIMLFQVLFSRWWLARHARGPLESLYSARIIGAGPRA